jgi:hypothetical protein
VCIDLLSTVIGREEADDVAGAVADIDVVVCVEDHVLGPVDLAKPNQLDRAKPIVHRVRRRFLGGGRRRQPCVGGGDIDLGQDFQAVLEPPDIDRHRDKENESEKQRVRAAGYAEAHQAVDHDHHGYGANHRFRG